MEVRADKPEAKLAHTTGFAKLINLLSRIIDPLNSLLGANIASLMLAAMMFLTFFDVAGRFILNKPISGSLELTEFLMSMLVCFALGYCALRKGHIRVDLILQYVSKKANQWFNVFAYGVSFIFFALVTWQTLLNASTHLSNKLSSAVLLIPLYPFIYIVTIGAAFVTLVFLRDFLESIKEVSE